MITKSLGQSIFLVAIWFASGVFGFTWLNASQSVSLTNEQIVELTKLSVPERLSIEGELLKPLLVPRVSGTEGNLKVQNFLIEELRKLDWHVEEDRFNDTTPMGVVSFNNIVATNNPNAKRKLVLAAHFDSKYFPPPDTFIGATDSAVPCAILLDIAHALNELLSSEKMRYNELALELVFLDGEEAFQTWTQTDSLYGARHLAEKWENTKLQDIHNPIGSDAVSRLQTIELFVLLDLIGAKGSNILNTQFNTSYFFQRLKVIERKLSALSLLSNADLELMEENEGYFGPLTVIEAGIDDDHRPFLEKGVPVLHLIPIPFPHVWHTTKDDASAIDHDSVVDFSLIMRLFVAEYLQVFA
ncbi:hypothetical protein K493DRAFT_266041 [Basidiobolus meristosporus CBS 931.73]|uniref:Peptide hydrolase n=1 Tax=Basidiobolus meristosporus CBS 931.73 TaxID=1314790 RepID=A0A1Y1XWW5_9FUNG|nr:hypothetical protein K493DRAFT_266041 [Basidiobolus meristosporus CBS 931.73]|eukprot:ORX90247.1 hypothetical protein K493DRAFT_266041 [Basidiobolus meristosporus CBS 931.73]